MDYSFAYTTNSDLGIGMIVFYVIYGLMASGVGIAVYVFRALSLYTIAKRRAIHHPWFAWVPVVDQYLLGCISDQYQYVVKGKNKSKRKVLLTLSIISALFAVVIGGFWIYFVGNTVVTAAGGAGEAALIREMVGMMFGLLGIMLLVWGVGIAAAVFRWMALYDVYSSCDPRNNTMFLVLGIVFGILEPVFLFLCRNKEEGMPPRKPEPQYEPPQYEPPQYEQPETNWEQTF